MYWSFFLLLQHSPSVGSCPCSTSFLPQAVLGFSVDRCQVSFNLEDRGHIVSTRCYGPSMSRCHRGACTYSVLMQRADLCMTEDHLRLGDPLMSSIHCLWRAWRDQEKQSIKKIHKIHNGALRTYPVVAIRWNHGVQLETPPLPNVEDNFLQLFITGIFNSADNVLSTSHIV